MIVSVFGHWMSEISSAWDIAIAGVRSLACMMTCIPSHHTFQVFICCQLVHIQFHMVTGQQQNLANFWACTKQLVRVRWYYHSWLLYKCVYSVLLTNQITLLMPHTSALLVLLIPTTNHTIYIIYSPITLLHPILKQAIIVFTNQQFERYKQCLIYTYKMSV